MLSSEILFKDWLDDALLLIKDDLKGFYFGLYETSEGPTMYLVGSNNVDKNNDWIFEQQFVAKERFSQFEKKSWQEVLVLSKKLISDYMISSPSSPLNKAKVIYVGFDDGDLIRVK